MTAFIEIRITASAETFEEIDRISFLISVYKNPCLFWGFSDIPEAERNAEIVRLEGLLTELSH